MRATTFFNLEVLTKLKSIKEIGKDIHAHKASGILRKSSFPLKICLMNTLTQLAYLINLSMQNNVIPESWKNATIILVYIAGCPQTPGNYRPISTLPMLAKILERCDHVQTSDRNNMLDRNNIFSTNQFGICKGVSTNFIDLDFTVS